MTTIESKLLNIEVPTGRVKAKVLSLDLDIELTLVPELKYLEASGGQWAIQLGRIALHGSDAIDVAAFHRIPGITQEKLRALHAKHREAASWAT